MIDAKTSDGKFAFQFEEWGDISDEKSSHGLPEDAFHPDAGVMVILKAIDSSSYQYEKVVGADQLQQALQLAGIME